MEAAIQTLVKVYLKSSKGKESLGKKDFQNLVKSQLGNILTNTDSKDAINNMAAGLDENQDGKLGFPEYMKLIGYLATSLSEQRCLPKEEPAQNATGQVGNSSPDKEEKTDANAEVKAEAKAEGTEGGGMATVGLNVEPPKVEIPKAAAGISVEAPKVEISKASADISVDPLKVELPKASVDLNVDAPNFEISKGDADLTIEALKVEIPKVDVEGESTDVVTTTTITTVVTEGIDGEVTEVTEITEVIESNEEVKEVEKTEETLS